MREGVNNLSEEEVGFLKELVKAARQKPYSVAWKDRDGSDRVTVMCPTEATKVNVLAQRLGVGKAEVLRQAAHVPAAK